MMFRHCFLAFSAIAIVSACGGPSRQIDVRNPPKVLEKLANIIPSKPLDVTDISAPCLREERLMVASRCEASVAASPLMMRKAHFHLASGGVAILSYTAAGGSDAIEMKVTEEHQADIPIRKGGGTLEIRCFECILETRAR